MSSGGLVIRLCVRTLLYKIIQPCEKLNNHFLWLIVHLGLSSFTFICWYRLIVSQLIKQDLQACEVGVDIPRAFRGAIEMLHQLKDTWCIALAKIVLADPSIQLKLCPSRVDFQLPPLRLCLESMKGPWSCIQTRCQQHDQLEMVVEVFCQRIQAYSPL